MLEKSNPGNEGNIGLYLELPETVPIGLCGEFRFDMNDKHVAQYDDDGTEVRALVEGQFLVRIQLWIEKVLRVFDYKLQ